MRNLPFKPEQLIYITATVQQLVDFHIPIGIAKVLVKRPIDRIVAVVDNLVRTTRSGSYWLNPEEGYNHFKPFVGFKPGDRVRVAAWVSELQPQCLPGDVCRALSGHILKVASVHNMSGYVNLQGYEDWNVDSASLVQVEEPVPILPIGPAPFPPNAGQTITPATERQIVLTPSMALTQDFLFQLLSLREQLNKNFLGLPLEGLDKISDALAEKLTRAIITEHQPKKS